MGYGESASRYHEPKRVVFHKPMGPLISAGQRDSVASFVPDDAPVAFRGDCPTGADAQADAWARAHARLVEPHPADWKAFGHAAGPMRNQAMVDSKPDLVLAFYTPGREHSRSRGTSMTVRMAHVAGLPVITWGRE